MFMATYIHNKTTHKELAGMYLTDLCKKMTFNTKKL